MKIIEDIKYNIEDIISQIKSDLGFEFTTTDDRNGYVDFGSGLKLFISFTDDGSKIKSAMMKFPSVSYDLVKSPGNSDLYSSCIESSVQIVDLINRMLGGQSE